jgi:hypothetical protein
MDRSIASVSLTLPALRTPSSETRTLAAKAATLLSNPASISVANAPLLKSLLTTILGATRTDGARSDTRTALGKLAEVTPLSLLSRTASTIGSLFEARLAARVGPALVFEPSEARGKTTTTLRSPVVERSLLSAPALQRSFREPAVASRPSDMTRKTDPTAQNKNRDVVLGVREQINRVGVSVRPVSGAPGVALMIGRALVGEKAAASLDGLLGQGFQLLKNATVPVFGAAGAGLLSLANPVQTLAGYRADTMKFLVANSGASIVRQANAPQAGAAGERGTLAGRIAPPIFAPEASRTRVTDNRLSQVLNIRDTRVSPARQQRVEFSAATASGETVTFVRNENGVVTAPGLRNEAEVRISGHDITVRPSEQGVVVMNGRDAAVTLGRAAPVVGTRLADSATVVFYEAGVSVEGVVQEIVDYRLDSETVTIRRR